MHWRSLKHCRAETNFRVLIVFDTASADGVWVARGKWKQRVFLPTLQVASDHERYWPGHVINPLEHSRIRFPQFVFRVFGCFFTIAYLFLSQIGTNATLSLSWQLLHVFAALPGFIMAEVMSFSDLKELGSEANVKALQSRVRMLCWRGFIGILLWHLASRAVICLRFVSHARAGFIFIHLWVTFEHCSIRLPVFSTYWAVHVDQKGLGGSQEFTGWRKWYKIQSDDLPATIFKYELGKQNQMQQSLDVAVACTVTRLCKVLQNSEDPINISPRSQAQEYEACLALMLLPGSRKVSSGRQKLWGASMGAWWQKANSRTASVHRCNLEMWSSSSSTSVRENKRPYERPYERPYQRPSCG